MRWTKESPKEPGWYWRLSFGVADIVRLTYSKQHKELWLEKMGTGMHENFSKYLALNYPDKWAGPITLPKPENKIRLKTSFDLAIAPDELATQCQLHWANDRLYTCPAEWFECPFKDDLSPCNLITAADWLNVCEEIKDADS